MVCSNCGKNLEPNELFCSECGTRQPIVQENTYGVGAEVFGVAKKSVNILVIVAAVVLAIGTLLPLYTISMFGMTESVSYIEGDGIFVLIAAIAIIVLTVLKKEKFAVIPAVISMGFLIYVGSELSNIGFGSFGPGLYLMWIGAVASAVTPFISLNK